ncbi:pyrin-like [Gymnodraco acuticeps]|uniref:Pyrin-like n=1 Tax=Gymnodraco acuticeps TaxID=8218 RepID=A0A6P8VI63_GYMAC|nr:pyrin-like [Gymnodraco acuticeps]
MVKLKEELWRTLLDLKEDEFKHFKWFLEQENLLEGLSGIPVSRLETADRKDTVDLMLQNYQDVGARELTKKILEKIGRNDLVSVLVRKDLKNHEKEQLAETKAEIKQMIQERQKRIDEISRSAEISSKSADRHIADSRQVYEVLQKSVERSLDNLIEDIEKKQETSRKQAEGFIGGLEKEISELTKRSAKVEQLSCSEDFLQSVQSLHAIPFTTNWTEISLTPPTYGGSVGKAVNLLEEIFKKEKEKLLAKAKLKRVQESEKDVTLDPETANAYLVLSDDMKRVYCGDVEQSLPDNPERCDPSRSVLGKQSFSSGRFYYEVLVKGKSSWDLGVVKGSIARKGKIHARPQNGYWTICLREGNKYQASAAYLKVTRQPERVGVFVNYERGSVYFYDVDSADLIHNFTDCAFTEKLYPFFSPGLHYDGKNSAPLIISPVDYSD